jgi:hypothetical protein
MARLAALVPRPRANLTRFHGVFAPNSRHRGRVTKARRVISGYQMPAQVEQLVDGSMNVQESLGLAE